MASDLCTACALCCDGTLFGSVKVEDEDRPHLRLPLVDGALAQPCAALVDRRCSVYAERPASCARYACELLKQVEAGVVRVAEARDRVDRMRARLAVARASFGTPADASIWQVIAALEAPKTAREEDAWARRHADGIAALGEVIAIARDVFEPDFAGGRRR